MQIGIDSFAAVYPDPRTGLAPTAAQRLQDLVEEIELADQVGLDAFGVGEHHRAEFVDAAPTMILAAAASRTKFIRLTSAVTVLSADDPVRVFQNFATLDLLSNGRAEIIAGRGSFVEAYPLFGYELADYDALFAEKLDLLLQIRDNPTITWQGKFRAPLDNQSIYPRPIQPKLPIWLGVGGTPASFARAGMLGLPLMIAIIGGEPHRFRPLVDLYRQAGRRAGHAPEALKVGLHMLGYVAKTDQLAADTFFPGYAHAFTKVGKERGWPPVRRPHYDALLGRTGALMIGSPETLADKIAYVDEALGGVARLNFQMSAATLTHAELMSATELLGTAVAPLVRRRFPSPSPTLAPAQETHP